MSEQGPAAYSIYDLLRTLCERVGWPTEDEKRVALQSINDAERMRIFGNLAADMACVHPDDDRSPSGQCMLCGRQIETQPGWGAGRSRRYGTPPNDGHTYQSHSGRGW